MRGIAARPSERPPRGRRAAFLDPELQRFLRGELAQDVVQDAAVTGASFSRLALAHVENLMAAGSATLSLTGNSLSNTLAGGALTFKDFFVI